MNRPSVFGRRSFMARVASVASALPAIAQVEQTSNRWQIGCYTRPWAAHDYRVALDAIAEAGFKYAGLMTTTGRNPLVISTATTLEEAAEIGYQCSQRGLGLPSAYGGDIPSAESVEAGIKGMHTLIDNCVAAGVANLMMGGVGTPELAVPYYKAIAESCAYADEKSLDISVKPHGGTNITGLDCRKAIESVNHKRFRLWYDPGNIYYYTDGQRNPVDDANDVDGIVSGMSVKDYQDPKIVDLTPGTGRVDFAKVLARLAQGGFRQGPLIIECLKPGTLPELQEEARKARAFVEQLVQTLV
ncbi:MAG: hypothetical protein AMXMBFR84_32190 [Candidatus Hydrogenedentota bacterium]